MGPIVSFIIPCYNQGQYLAFAVESALAQGYPHIEVIVVDDGSTDDTAQVMAHFTDNPKVKFLQQKNGGPGAARNAGAAACSGRYLNFLDADDTVTPEKIKKQIVALESDSRLGFVYSDVTHMGENGAPVCNGPSIADSRRELSGDIFNQLFVGGYFPPHAPLVRRSAFDQVGGFDPSLRGCCDWDLWLRLAAEGFTAQFVQESLAWYRLHPGGMSRDTRHMREDEGRVIAKIVALFPHRAAEAYAAIRRQVDDLWEANTWLNTHRETIEKENAELRKHVVVLNACPKYVRYPIYGLLMVVGRTCSFLKKLKAAA